MSEDQTLNLYLDPPTLAQAVRRRHNFLNRVVAAVTARGWKVAYHADTPAERARALGRPGWSLAHMTEAPGAAGLTFRRAVHSPFWQIDVSAERWLWSVAAARFDPAGVDPETAERFAGYWKNRVYKAEYPHPQPYVAIFVPLQGRLLEQRSFQAASPIEMLRETLRRLPDTTVIARLHPRETYGADEVDALHDLTRSDRRLILSDRPALELLAECAGVVTQNSSLAFLGFLRAKPALLFARIDFHHIAASVPRDGIDVAFKAFATALPPFASYVWWYWQEKSINAGRPDAEARILAALRRGGMPV